MKFAVRKYLLQLHRWAGLTVGLAIVIIAVTGAAMVFRPQIEPLLNADLLTVRACVERVPLDTLTANALAAHPASRPSLIRIIAEKDAVIRIPSTSIRFADKNTVYLNPCTGAVLGQENINSSFFGIVETLHRFRYLENGSAVTGTIAILFGTILILGGFFMWWPATRQGWKNALKLKFRLTGSAYKLNLHKFIGAYAGLIVLASVLTGLPQAFNWFRNGVFAATGSTLPVQPPKSVGPAVAQRLPMEEIWQRTQALVPQLQEAQLRYPSKPLDSVEVSVLESDAPHPNALTMIFIDAYSGKVLRYSPYATSSIGQKLYFWTFAWHTGLIGGLFGQLLLMIGALSVPVLAYTGIASYLRRKFPARVASRLLVRVIKKTDETRKICTFELVSHSGIALPSFEAGSHIDVYIRNGLVRQYSLCNDPHEDHRFLIAVQRDYKSRGGSRTLHDEIHEGDVIEISMPKNHFPLVPSAARSLLLAGGIGVTPILCMAERLSNIGADFDMHYCGRSLPHMAFIDRIRESAYANRVSLHCSNGAPEQLINFAELLGSPDPQTHLYVCGPAGFMDVVLDTAKQQGWADKNVHKEYFAADVCKLDSDVEFDVKIASTGKIYRIPCDKTVLAALSESGIDIPNSCVQGVCGTCLTRVLEGVPDHRGRYLSDEEQAKNDQFLPCCARAHSALLVLDL